MMKKITGYVKCPICEGKGQHTTEAFDSAIMNASHVGSGDNFGPPLSQFPVPEPEYQECTKCKGEQVLPLWGYDE